MPNTGSQYCRWSNAVPVFCSAGIIDKIGWHTFRRTFSMLIRSLGVDANIVQEFLRHASFKAMMDGYTQHWKHPNTRHNLKERSGVLLLT